MKLIPLAILLSLPAILAPAAQSSRPTTDCPFPDNGFALAPGQKPQIAEVAQPGAVQLEACGSPRGCISTPVARGTPMQVYRQQGQWTCGYVTARDGAGPAWIRTGALRIIPYDENPPLSAWVGTWTGLGDHLRIRIGTAPGTLHLTGHAEWHGKSSTHLGDTEGTATPLANRLHFVEAGPDSCTIDLTLLNRYILASDNNACGGMNVRFDGIWKRTAP